MKCFSLLIVSKTITKEAVIEIKLRSVSVRTFFVKPVLEVQLYSISLPLKKNYYHWSCLLNGKTKLLPKKRAVLGVPLCSVSFPLKNNYYQMSFLKGQ